MSALGLLALSGSAAACSKRSEPDKIPPVARPARAIPQAHTIPRPDEAVASFAVLTRASPAEASARAALEGSDAHGVTCDVRQVAEWGMPPPDALAEMAGGLTPDERAALPRLGTVVVVTARSEGAHDALAARGAWSATRALAGALDGLVYDETLHRIEDARTFATHAIPASTGTSAWREDWVSVQLYEQGDGTARLLTLGMRRFGAPDLEIEGAPMNDGRALGTLVSRAAQKIVEGASTAPLSLAPAAEVDLVPAPHHEGDPDNVVLRIVPVATGGSDAGPYDALVARVLGPVDGVVATESRDLDAIAVRARAALPGAIDRWSRARDAGATLLVKLPFHVTSSEAPRDAGAFEWMWVSVTDADADASTVSGTLANTPVYVSDLRSGARVSGRQSDVADYVLDVGRGTRGTKEGGESIRSLSPNAAAR